jgi:hypothetical protein
VICSDSDLSKLADDRQQAFNEAMARLDAQQQKELKADQTAWVHAYATACGIPPNRPPANPVPETVKACFRQAGEARIAYLGTYGGQAQSTAPAPTQTVPAPAAKPPSTAPAFAPQPATIGTGAPAAGAAMSSSEAIQLAIDAAFKHSATALDKLKGNAASGDVEAEYGLGRYFDFLFRYSGPHVPGNELYFADKTRGILPSR